MIQLNLEIMPADGTPPEQEEALREALRQATLRFVFDAADSIGMSHTILVDGSIKIIED